MTLLRTALRIYFRSRARKKNAKNRTVLPFAEERNMDRIWQHFTVLRASIGTAAAAETL